MAGIFNIIAKLFGNKYDKDIKQIRPIVDKIHLEHKKISQLSHDQLRNQTKILKSKINDFVSAERNEITQLKEKSLVDNISSKEKENLYNKIDSLEKKVIDKIEEILESILPTAFAVIKETAQRFKDNREIIVQTNEFDISLASTKDFVSINDNKAIYKNTWSAAGIDVTWDMVHYDVQLIGGIVLHQGKIAEMQTGEGKTLVATLPVYLNALAGLGVHLVTVNNYLAKRDSEWMGPLFQFHGLSIDCIDNHQPNSEERRQAYLADITYGTNNEFGFDYLRDNMAKRPADLVQRKLNYSIVDEVDSVLIDDARTPLIISGPTPKGDEHEYNELKHKIDQLVKVQQKYVTTVLSDAKKFFKEGDKEKGGFNLFRAYRGLPKNKALIKFLSEEGIKAQLQKTENYFMQDQNKEMHIIDEELFFVIDEKNNQIELTEKGLNLMTTSIEDKDFFILPDVGQEIAEIDKSISEDKQKAIDKESLLRNFSIKSERIHTVNQLLKAYALFEKDVEYVVMDNKVKIVDEQTGRIMDGRRYSDGLHQAIEAKENVKIEAATQTYATVTLQNYFRMYNKISGMTGTAETEAGEFWEIYKLDVISIPTNRPIQRDDKDDLVYKTNREKYNAVIEDIDKLSKEGRPILVGTTSVEISELLSTILRKRGIKHNVLNAKLHQKEADIVAEAGNKSAVTIATNMAGRGTDIKLSNEVKASGGLAIIGTERHDSRRVDRQLRGRAGRQGDPGSSQFYVSLEDNLMRLFGSERIAKLMDRMGLEEGEVIQHSMVSKSIERAQKKVEENNFGIRKRLLEYDDVMNQQREVIYKKRRNALYGDRLSLDINNAIYDWVEENVNEYKDLNDYHGFKSETLRHLAFDPNLTEEKFNQSKSNEITQNLFTQLIDTYNRKNQNIKDKALVVFNKINKERGKEVKNILVPFSDGKKSLNVSINLKKAIETNGEEIINAFERYVALAIIDENWKDHLRELDDLKQSANNASIEQKDPLLIYKLESFNLFQSMISSLNSEMTSILFKGDIATQDSEDVKEAKEIKRTENRSLKTSRASEPIVNQNNNSQNNQEQPKETPVPVRAEQKVGRNDDCPCGSGKKYKKCHGKNN